MNRETIPFPERLKISPFRLTKDISLREIIILGGALFFCFVSFFILKDILGFFITGLIVVGIAVSALLIALVPIRGYHAEHFIIIYLKSRRKPRKYIHKTAFPETQYIAEEQPAHSSQPQKPHTSPQNTADVSATVAYADKNIKLYPEKEISFDPYVAFLVSTCFFVILGLSFVLIVLIDR